MKTGSDVESLGLWTVLPPYAAVTRKTLEVDEVNVTEQRLSSVAGVIVFGDKPHEVVVVTFVSVFRKVNVTVPEGGVFVPRGSMSVTVAVHVIVPLIGATIGMQLTAVVVARRLTVTASEQLLLVSLLSASELFGSAEQTPPDLGLVRVPAAVGVVSKETVKLPPDAKATPPPLAVQLRLLLEIEQLIVPVPLVPAVVTDVLP